MQVKDVGHAGLHGWRERFADRAAKSISKRTRASEDAVRAALGLGFLALSIRYLTKTVADLRRSNRR